MITMIIWALDKLAVAEHNFPFEKGQRTITVGIKVGGLIKFLIFYLYKFLHKYWSNLQSRTQNQIFKNETNKLELRGNKSEGYL